ncbi:uncharacterized protein LOC119108417 [Pollicipes pollicipes]|uniref:uncharacterized protein LOC119108417 n=1 Tax=Pollicipes pollicipes TaxID=41117 RepID=UPI001884B2B3|nr:uncharacterized protein LOC119108417 [Pollicipes pollicipes]
MASPASRCCLAVVALLAALLLLAGLSLLVCGIFLLLQAPHPLFNGCTIVAGLWDVLAGLFAVILCVTGPRRVWQRSQLQLGLLCSAPAVNVAHFVIVGLSPHGKHIQAVATGVPEVREPPVAHISILSTVIAAAISFVAGNVVFCMQLLFDQYQVGARTWSSPKSNTTSSPLSFTYAPYQAQMVQKSDAPDLWLPSGVPLASWVYRSQSSCDAPVRETRLDEQPPGRADTSATNGRACRAASACWAPSTGPRRADWPPSARQLRSFSLLEVRSPSPAAATVDLPASSDSLLLLRRHRWRSARRPARRSRTR